MNPLFEKYNVAGPRYTSYPTVPYWETTPTPDQWIQCVHNELVSQSSRGGGYGLYVHIPFCESLCTYCGCNTRITRNHKVASPYIQTVLREWELYREGLERLGLSKLPPLEDLHLGGGTPTFLSPEELSLLLSGLTQGRDTTTTTEFAVEADPRVTHAEHLEVLSRFGFRRLSLGIQDFDPKVQDIVHRVQSEEQVARLIERARATGFSSINFDLIYGLPLQTEQSVRATVEAVRRLRPDRIAFYSYAHVPWIKPSQRRFTEADLPSGDAKRRLYEVGRDLLEAAGYAEVGMDHFALKSDSLWTSAKSGELHRNFMGYIPRQVSPLIGLGVSAIGDSWTAFSQNEKHLENYERSVAAGKLPVLRGHVLTEEDLVLRRHILNLMCRFETDWSGAEVEFLSDVASRMEEFARDRLVSIGGKRVQVLEEGRPFLRNICMAFDARLKRKAPETQLFSQTV